MIAALLPARTVHSGLLGALADLFRYPDGCFSPRLARALALDGEEGLLGEFGREISPLDPAQRQATYTSTFDLAPSCPPYVGVHLFGDEGRDRGRLLTGLRASYQKAGMAHDEGELPDHIAEVLAFAAHDQTEEWRDLLQLILVPALAKMEALLRGTSNPYRLLIAAARQASELALSEGVES